MVVHILQILSGHRLYWNKYSDDFYTLAVQDTANNDSVARETHIFVLW